ncbi:MAG: outer membrane beta-barrel protein [Myxococcota bacterium]
MRTNAKVLALAACMLMVGAPLAFADEVSDELAEMRAIVEQLQSQVDAQSEQISHQGEVIQQARIQQSAESDSRFGASGIAAFIQRLQVDGHLAGSYWWNFNDPGKSQLLGGNQGAAGLLYPFHQNYNNFQVDQVWFGLEHPVDEENRAGFRFDMLFGNTACSMVDANGRKQGFDNGPSEFGDNDAAFKRCRTGINSGDGVEGDGDDGTWGDNTSEYYVHQAYVQYLAPITQNGIHFKAGKFATLVGAEVMNTTQNFNITRGALYSILQPIDHVGVLASTDLGDSGWSATVGILNSNFLGDPDFNETKSVTGQLAYAGETIGGASTVIWGGDKEWENGEASGIWDVVMTWDPSDNLSTWVNFDYAWQTIMQNSHAWGLAAAGRYAVTERMGISMRGEFVKDHASFIGFGHQGAGFAPAQPKTSRLYTLTGTVDYALTNNLMMRAEVRYDNITKRNANNNEFFDHGNDFVSDQVTSGVEIVYEF